MHYPVKALFNDVEKIYQFTVPDLVGCTITSKSIDEGMRLLKDEMGNYLKILAEYGETIPHAKTVGFYLEMKTEEKAVWAIIDIDIMPYLGKSHKINVTLPELLINQIDNRVSKSESYKTRSGFIAAACSNELLK